MKNIKINKIKNNEQYKRGFALGYEMAEKFKTDDPEKYEKIKKAFEKIMKGEKNVDL